MEGISPKPDIESSIWIGRPPEVLWEYLCDVSNDIHWRERVTAGRWISDPPHGVGSTGLTIVEGVGDWPWKITVWEEARRMSWVVTGGRFEASHAGYRIEPQDKGSQMTLQMSLKPGPLSKIFLFIMKGAMERQLGADLEKLKAILEP